MENDSETNTTTRKDKGGSTCLVDDMTGRLERSQTPLPFVHLPLHEPVLLERVRNGEWRRDRLRHHEFPPMRIVGYVRSDRPCDGLVHLIGCHIRLWCGLPRGREPGPHRELPVLSPEGVRKGVYSAANSVGHFSDQRFRSTTI